MIESGVRPASGSPASWPASSALAAGAVVVTPAIYALYDQRNAPAELREPLLAAPAQSAPR